MNIQIHKVQIFLLTSNHEGWEVPTLKLVTVRDRMLTQVITSLKKNFSIDYLSTPAIGSSFIYQRNRKEEEKVHRLKFFLGYFERKSTYFNLNDLIYIEKLVRDIFRR